MKRPGDHLLTQFSQPPARQQPARVVELKGVIFQSDNSSVVGELFIRPIETFDRWQLGLSRGAGDAPLAMHAGLHVVVEGGREFVAEQLVGSLFENFEDGLNWTPLEAFRQRQSTGWDVTVPATCFRGISATTTRRTTDFLNAVQGRPFFCEDCVAFIERAFGGRRLFGDSPTAMALGVGLRVGDPALPLLRSDAPLSARAARLLRVETVRKQADPLASCDAPNARVWLGKMLTWATAAVVLEGVHRLVQRGRRIS